VVPLTAPASGSEELLGGGATRPAHSDPVATRVLVKGEPAAPSPGRADDFKWPRGGDASSAEPLPPAVAAARAEPAAAPTKPAPKADTKQAARESAKDVHKTRQPAEKPKTSKPQAASGQAQPRPPAPVELRPPQPVQQQPPRQSGGLFGLFR
jgi:hypothetical protein